MSTTSKKKITKSAKVDVVFGYRTYVKGELYADEEKNKVFVNHKKFRSELEDALYTGVRISNSSSYAKRELI